MPGSLSVNAWNPVLRSCGRLCAHAAPELDDVTLGVARTAEQFDRVFSGRAAYLHVVAADELRVPYPYRRCDRE